jgi:hypothetical protein
MVNDHDNERLAKVNTAFDREMQFYTKWAKGAFQRYSIFNITSLLFGAAVPIIALVPGLWGGDNKEPWVIAAAGISGAISALLRSIDGFQKNKDEWMDASHLLAKLRSEKLLFETSAGKYADTTKDTVAEYAESIEALIQDEGDSWWQQVKATPPTGNEQGDKQ